MSIASVTMSLTNGILEPSDVKYGFIVFTLHKWEAWSYCRRIPMPSSAKSEFQIRVLCSYVHTQTHSHKQMGWSIKVLCSHTDTHTHTHTHFYSYHSIYQLLKRKFSSICKDPNSISIFVLQRFHCRSILRFHSHFSDGPMHFFVIFIFLLRMK